MFHILFTELWDVELGFNFRPSLFCCCGGGGGVPQEIGPIQTRRGCLVFCSRRFLVGLDA